MPIAEFFAYAVDKRLAPFWLPFGLWPSTDGVTITDDATFRATFGFLSVQTPLTNIDRADVTAATGPAYPLSLQPARPPVPALDTSR